MMGPHLIWAGVVLVLGVLAVRAVRLRWRDRETFAEGLRHLAQSVDLLRREMTALQDAFSGHRNVALDRFVKLSELEQVVKALSAAGSGAKPAPQRRV